MEGGQKNKVELSSQLDVKSADMLIPASDPKVLHNRQKFQGRYLPTSLRYEHDGWAAGWDVYQFTFNSNEETSDPEGFYLIKNKINNNPAYMLVFQKDMGEEKRKTMARIWWNYESSTTDTSISCEQGDCETTFSGTLAGKDYTVTVNPVTGQIDASPADFDVVAVLGDDGKYLFTIIDTTKTENVAVDRLHDGKPVVLNDEYTVGSFVSIQDGVYTWRDNGTGITTTYDAENGVLLDGATPNDVTLSLPDIEFVLNEVFTMTGIVKYTYNEWYPSVLKSGIAYDNSGNLVANDMVTISSNSLKVNDGVEFNKWLAHLQKSGDKPASNTHLCADHPVIIDGYIPQWAGIFIGFANQEGVEDVGSIKEYEGELQATGVYSDGYATVKIKWTPIKVFRVPINPDELPDPNTTAIGTEVYEEYSWGANDGSGTLYAATSDEVQLARNVVRNGEAIELKHYVLKQKINWEESVLSSASELYTATLPLNEGAANEELVPVEAVVRSPTLPNPAYVGDYNIGDTLDDKIWWEATDGSGRAWVDDVSIRASLRDFVSTGDTVTLYRYTATAAEREWVVAASKYVYGYSAVTPSEDGDIESTWKVTIRGVSDEDRMIQASDKHTSGVTVSIWEGTTRLTDVNPNAYEILGDSAKQPVTFTTSITLPAMIVHNEYTPMPVAPTPVDPSPLPANIEDIPAIGGGTKNLTDRTLTFEITVDELDPYLYSFPETAEIEKDDGTTETITNTWNDVFRITLECGAYRVVKTGDEITISDISTLSEAGVVVIKDGFFYDSLNDESSMFAYVAKPPMGHYYRKNAWSSKKWTWDSPGEFDLIDGEKIVYNAPATDVIYSKTGNYRYVKGGGDDDPPGYQCLCIVAAYKAYYEAKVTLTDRLSGTNLQTNLFVELAEAEDSIKWPADDTDEDGSWAARNKRYWIDRDPDPVTGNYLRASHRFDVEKLSVDISDTTFTLKMMLVPLESTYMFYTYETLADAKKRFNSKDKDEDAAEKFIEGYVPGHILYDDLEYITTYEQYMKAVQLSTSNSDTNNTLRFALTGQIYPVRSIEKATLNLDSNHRYPHRFFDDVFPGLNYFDLDSSTVPPGVVEEYVKIDDDGYVTAREYVTFVNDWYTLIIRHDVEIGRRRYDDTLKVIGGTEADPLYDTDVFDAGGYEVTLDAEHATVDLLQTNITMQVPLEYVFKTRIPFIDQTAYNIVSFLNNVYVIQGPLTSFTVKTDALTVLASDSSVYPITKHEIDDFDAQGHDEGYSFAFTSKLGYVFPGTVRGPYKTQGVTVIEMDSGKLVVEIEGEQYTFDISRRGLFNFDVKDEMKFLATDVRDERLTQRHFHTIDPSEEFQFLKQQWDTTLSTESFWWVDSEHILAITKTQLVLRQKAATIAEFDGVELDDWNGDTWLDVASWHRSNYVGSGKTRWGMTCAKGGVSALFWTIELSSETTMLLRLYDTLNDMAEVQVTIGLRQRSLGEKLNDTVKELCTYSDLQMVNLIAQAEYSSTRIGEYVLFGIHLDKNFNQWCAKIRISNGSLVSCDIAQGYGYVGLDGSLTGGEIPDAYYDDGAGFNSIVHPIEKLKAETREAKSVDDFYAIDIEGAVVGNDSQQWYITKELKGIVSHCVWTGSSWVAKVIPLNNNVSQIYGSPSSVQKTLTDFTPHVSSGLSSFLPMGGDPGFDVLDTIFAVAGVPSFYSVFPKINSIVYLQQSMGQYAYVHYNSKAPHQSKDLTQDDSENMMGSVGTSATADELVEQEMQKNPLELCTSDELSFNVKQIAQKGIADKMPMIDDLLTMLITASCSAASFGAGAAADAAAKLNDRQNQTATQDTGKKYSQYFLQNADSLGSSMLAVRGSVPVQTSTVTGTLTLDMFYSTSDKQAVSAGPGWVNHNFVAQCVAQSVTTTHLELSQVGAYCLFSALSMAEMYLQMRVQELAVNGIYKLADIASNLSISVMGSGGTAPGQALAAILTGVAKVLEARLAIQQTMCDVLPSLLKMFGADEVKIQTTAQKSVHSMDAEGKHNYGSNSEAFFWPCYDCGKNKRIKVESVEAGLVDKPWLLQVPQFSNAKVATAVLPLGSPLLEPSWTATYDSHKPTKYWDGDVPYFIANCRGKVSEEAIPDDMAYVLGTETFLPETYFRNENIGEGTPVFSALNIQDYIIDRDWQLACTSGADNITVWTSCKDTKILDGDATNIVVSDEFCGVASEYCAIEIKRGVKREYLRPWAITPQVLALNQTGYNCCLDGKAYHAFDGYGYRLVSWVGSSGIGKEYRAFQYSFIANNFFKRSNQLPHNTFMGNFKGDPVLAINALGDDRVVEMVTVGSLGKGIGEPTLGEDKNIRRLALPVFVEPISTLPAVVKTANAVNLSVVEGMTSLVTPFRQLETAYKTAGTVDFTIGTDMYRYTEEYICSLTDNSGVITTKQLVPCLGLSFLGSTPYEAYLYSPATKQYYKYTGGSSLQMVDMIERFRGVSGGKYDFVNQEVLVPCLATFTRLDKNVEDDENEVDNLMIPRLKDGQFLGEVWPPTETLFNTRSWFNVLSLPCGVAYQGPNRVAINRFVLSDYMIGQIKDNYGRWQRVPREKYHPFRVYKAQYERVDEDIGEDVEVIGWTHNPFLFVTAPLGVDNETDCMFEWEITFCWPVEMDKLYGIDHYATVNITAECMTPGGKVVAERPTHVYLHKELFTRTGNYGYYSFRYQSRCGAGNRERLHIWSDQYIALAGLQVEYKAVTSKRTEILVQQVDVQKLIEI